MNTRGLKQNTTSEPRLLKQKSRRFSLVKRHFFFCAKKTCISLSIFFSLNILCVYIYIYMYIQYISVYYSILYHISHFNYQPRVFFPTCRLVTLPPLSTAKRQRRHPSKHLCFFGPPNGRDETHVISYVNHVLY